MEITVKVAKVKSILPLVSQFSPESIKSRIMAVLTPQEANQVYNHFTINEPDYIRSQFKVDVWEVIPRSDEYWTGPKKILDFEDDEDEPYWL